MQSKILSVPWLAISNPIQRYDDLRAAHLLDHGSKRLFHKPDLSSGNWLPRMKATERTFPTDRATE